MPNFEKGEKAKSVAQERHALPDNFLVVIEGYLELAHKTRMRDRIENALNTARTDLPRQEAIKQALNENIDPSKPETLVDDDDMKFIMDTLDQFEKESQDTDKKAAA